MTTDTPASPKSLTKRQAFWQSHLEACKAEGVSLAAYARQQQLPVASLYAARSRLKTRSRAVAATPARTGPMFLPVKLPQPVAHPPAVLRVVLKNGVVVEVPEDSQPSHCRMVLESAGGLS